MEKSEVSVPISTIFNGSNYVPWSQAMSSYLKGRKLWRIVTGGIPMPTAQPNESSTKLEERIEDWDSKNHQILTWLRNTTIPSIHIQFGRFETAKQVWDFLQHRYSTTDITHQYQLFEAVHHMKHDPGQSINDFVSKMQSLWDQLALSEPQWDNTADAYKFTVYRDQLRVMQLLMSLHSDYEPVRASLLHRGSFPSFDVVVAELLSEETRLGLLKPTRVDTVAATHSKPFYGNSLTCNYCHAGGHLLYDCPIRPCPRCHQVGHRSDSCPFNSDRKRSGGSSSKSGYSRRPGTFSKPPFHRNTAAAASQELDKCPSPSVKDLSVDDLVSLIKQVQMNNSSPTALSVTPGTKSWFYDSGCCNHMTHDSDQFSHKQTVNSIPSIATADGSSMTVSHIGTISTSSLSVDDTYLIPTLSLNLISVGQLTELDLDVKFSKHGCCVQDPQTGQIVGTGRKVGRLFELTALHLPQYLTTSVAAATTTSPPTLQTWHTRLGHLSLSLLQKLVSSGSLGQVINKTFDCLSCPLAKQSALPFSNSEFISSTPFDLIHSDIWGPSPIASMSGSRYFVIFLDDYTRFTWIYLMKTRSELKQIYAEFANMIKTQFSKTIKVLRSDNAMEYNDSDFLNFLKNSGTISQRSCPGTSQQNGRAERKHRHILNIVRSFLISSSCPEKFWGEAALTAVYIINRLPTPVINNQTPYERLYGVPPTYFDLKTFGCVCFVLLQPHEYTKLEPRARLCCFLGYGIGQKGYRCWDPISNRLRVSRNVTFLEHEWFSTISTFHHSTLSSTSFFTDSSTDLFPEEPSDSPRLAHNDQSEPASDIFVPPDEPAPAVHLPPTNPVSTSLPPKRIPKPNIRLQDYHCFSAIVSLHEPTSYREASSNPEWQQAMSDELQALEKAKTWELVDLPPGQSVIGSKWIYKIKTRSDGSIERYKARLVAKGYTQEYGIDYEETFAPVARLTSVRSLLAVAAARHWPLFQMDVKNAFLNGDLVEDVYMQPPPGFSHPSNKVCKLRRSLYGLKQAPRAWFEKFENTVRQFGFTVSNHDSALFIRRTASGIVLLLLYVDDMIITGDDDKGISELKRFLHQHFEMKDLGFLSYFLGLEVTSNSSGYSLSQAKYASDLISRAAFTDSKIDSTPLPQGIKLDNTSGSLLSEPTRYRQLVGGLVYLTVTRPDIAYAVHLVSQYLSSPRTTHYDAVLHILRYVKGTLFHGLHFSAHSSLELSAYSDADWNGDPTDRRSTTGFCFFLGDSLISWRAKKQTLCTRSSSESEYRALADTVQELIWLRWLLADMGVTHLSATSLHCDNQSAIQIAHNDVFHERTKHIESDCHFTRQHVKAGTVRLYSISSADQTADIFTKSHHPGRFRDLCSKLRLIHTLPP